MGEPAVNWFPEELEACKPPERVTISEWAAKYRVLGANSAIKGLFQLNMVPFFVPIMNKCQSMNVDEVVVCAPAQIGKTTTFLNVIGFFTDQDPSPVMVILADEKTAKYVGAKQIKPMFKDSVHLRRLYSPNEFTRTEIDLANGAYIALAWASSVAELATKSMRIVYFDEVNKPGYQITTKEADALSLGRERTESYPEGYFLHLISSTPTDEDGNITRELESCDIIYDWHVPCPHCGQSQPLRFSHATAHIRGFEDGMYRAEDGTRHRIGQVVWDGGRNATNKQILETARYVCGECGALWTTQEKNEAVRQGKMVPRTEPTGYERKIGYHLNRIYSLFDGGRLEKIVRNWVGIFKEPPGLKRQKKLQGFVNSTLAEPWKEVTVTSTETRILNARCALPPQTLPREVVGLTCGIDQQKYGFWFVVRAWARDYTSWLIHYGQLATWEDIETLLFETAYPIQTEEGEEEQYMRIWRAALDTGGGKGVQPDVTMTEAAYFWLRFQTIGRGCKVWGTKGSSRPLAGRLQMGKVLDKTPSGKALPGGLQLVHVDTDKGKDLVYYRLQQAMENATQAAYLHSETDDIYAKQILAAEKQRDSKGVETWVQTKVDDHLLDCEVLAHVLADPEWPGGGVSLLRPPVPVKKTTPDMKSVPANWQRGGGFQRPSWLENR